MIRNRLAFLDPVLFQRLQRTSRRFVAIKARLRSRLQQSWQPFDEASGPTQDGAAHEITIASYNIHKCVGTDGRFDPARIAAVIAEMDADVVAIQEADKRFGRRQGLLDLKALEGKTGLCLVPTSAAADGHGWHGNALLLKQGRRRKHAPAGASRGRAARRAGRRSRASRRPAAHRRGASRPFEAQPPLAAPLDPRRHGRRPENSDAAARRPQ